MHAINKLHQSHDYNDACNNFVFFFLKVISLSNNSVQECSYKHNESKKKG